jgi:hypothetical protein
VANNIGNVSPRRYGKLVDQAQDAMRKIAGHQFAIGDMALEIEPARPSRHGRDERVSTAVQSFAADIGEVYETVRTWRLVAAAWPADKRSADASYTVHRIFASRSDRFMLIRTPPLDRRGRRRWTVDAADEVVGRVNRVSHDTRVSRIRELAQDDTVASTMTAEFLRRPDVAQRVLADPDTRRHLYQAQRDHDEQVGHTARQRTPAIAAVEHSLHFLDLMGTAQTFVAGIRRLVPQLQADPLTDEERAVTHHLLDQVHNAVGYCRTVIDTGDLDHQLARLLDEEQEGP